MNFFKFLSLSKHHETLCEKVNWYSKWHKHPYHKHIHWLTFSFFTLISILAVYNSYMFKPNFTEAKNTEKDTVAVEEKSEKDKSDKKENEKIIEEKNDENKKDEKSNEIQTEEILNIVDEKNDEETERQEDKKQKTEDKEEESLEKTKEESKVEEVTIIEKIADFISEKAENIEKIEIITNETVVIQNDEQIIDLSEFIANIEKNLEIPVEENTIPITDDTEEQNTDTAEKIETNTEEEFAEEILTEETPPLAIEATSTEEPFVEELLAIEEPVEETPPLTEEPVILPNIPVLETATVLDVTSPVRNNKYRTGPISIHIIFSKPVEVNGSPALSINTGNPSETLINYESGSGTDTLIFIYNIASSNFSSDLNYNSVDSLSLNGGSIKDINGNDASIILPSPNSSHSLGGNKDIKIDTTLKTPNIIRTD